MKTSLKIGILFISGLAVVSCGNGKNEAAEQAEMANQVKAYKVLKLEPRSTTLNTDYPASMQGQQNIEIRPRIDGYVEKIYVDEGAVVKAGDPLFRINAPQYEQDVRTAVASIKNAEAQLSTAKLAVNKVKPLVEKDIISKYELETAEYTYESAQATLAQAKASLVNAQTNLSYTLVTSPVNGVVGSIPFRLGSLVSSTTADPLTTVSSIGNVYAYFAMNEKVLLEFTKQNPSVPLDKKLEKMPKVNLVLSDGTIYAEQGNVETVNGLINTATGSANIRAKFPNPKGIIRSGSSTIVRIPQSLKDVILIPQSATFELQDKRFVVLAGKDGITKVTAVTVMENTAGNFFVADSGVKAGDQIVLEGVSTIKDGSKIKANPENPGNIYKD